MAREISDFAAAMVSTVGDSHARPGEFVTQVRQLRKMHVWMTIRTVILERARGSSWAELAAAMGYTEAWVRATYEPAEQRWLAILEGREVPEPQTISEALELPPNSVPVIEDDIRAAAAELDDWCRQRAASLVSIPSGEMAPPGRPVSEGIEQR